MKNTSKLILAFTFFIILANQVFSQKALKKAEEAFDHQQYFTAINFYKEAYTKAAPEIKPMILFKIGWASLEINDYNAALVNLQKAIAANYSDPLMYFYLGQVLKIQEKYDDAIDEFKNYKSKGGDSKKADKNIKSCELAKLWMETPTRYKVSNVSMINSKGRDYATSFSDKNYKELVFTSNREGGKGSEEINVGSNKSDIYKTKVDKNHKWSVPELLPPSISSEFNEGQAWVSHKGDLIFFTRCPEEKNKQIACGLYMSKKQGATWGEATALPMNNDSINIGHPCLSDDGKILYFSARLPGGYGGADIWSCTYDIKNNSWGQPKNAGSTINTSGDEMYPTLSSDGKKLYFSSNFHPGMGGLDIFVAEAGADGKFTKNPENLKSPINSSLDDFSIVFEGKKQTGYFTSNREGGVGDDDIWSFELPILTFNCKGNVFCEGDPNTQKGKNEPVESVKIKLVGSNGSISEVNTLKDGSFSFKLKERTTYTLSTETGIASKSTTFNKDGFLANTANRIITTVGEDKSKDFTKADFFVKPILPTLRMPQVQYASGSAALLPDSKDSLNYLYNLLKDNPTINCELNAHTDSNGKPDANMTLSQKRAESCVEYLVKEKGIPAARLTANGFGQTKLLISDDVKKAAKSKSEKDEIDQKNRRTEFKVLNFNFVDPNAQNKPTKVKSDDEEE